MNFETELALSYYKELTQLNSEHRVSIVQHLESRQLYVKKVLDTYNTDVYYKLQQCHIAGIPQIHEIIESENQLVLIEQYVPGKTLTEYINTESIDDAVIQKFIVSLCQTVQQLHEMDPPVIHRDIKPSNIIITPQGDTCLLDFNAAKAFSIDKDSDTLLIGTHGYAAPEQYGFAPSSPQTDIFAIGMVMKDLTAAASLKTHRFDSIIETCTRLDPKDRYSTVTELMNALNIQANNHSVLTKIVSHEASVSKSIGWKRFLFPGMNSKHITVRIISILFYVFCAICCVRTDFNRTIPFSNNIERILEFFLLTSIVLVFGNYLGIQNLMPLCKNDNIILRFIGKLLITAILLAVIFTIMTIVFGIWHIAPVT